MNMRSSVAKERTAILVVTALLLWWRGLEPAHIAAAVVGVVFFCWLVGAGRTPCTDKPPEPEKHVG